MTFSEINYVYLNITKQSFLIDNYMNIEIIQIKVRIRQKITKSNAPPSPVQTLGSLKRACLACHRLFLQKIPIGMVSTTLSCRDLIIGHIQNVIQKVGVGCCFLFCLNPQLLLLLHF